jgi:hypothetical protein
MIDFQISRNRPVGFLIVCWSLSSKCINFVEFDDVLVNYHGRLELLILILCAKTLKLFGELSNPQRCCVGSEPGGVRKTM